MLFHFWPALTTLLKSKDYPCSCQISRKRWKLVVKELKENDKLLEAQRLAQRTNYDLEMLETMGYCNMLRTTALFDGRV